MLEDEEVIDELSEPGDVEGEKELDMDQDRNHSRVAENNIKDDGDNLRKVESQLTYDTKFSDDDKEQSAALIATNATVTA